MLRAADFPTKTPVTDETWFTINIENQCQIRQPAQSVVPQ